jgi:hypothetical protein
MNEDVNVTAAPPGGSPALRAQEEDKPVAWRWCWLAKASWRFSEDLDPIWGEMDGIIIQPLYVHSDQKYRQALIEIATGRSGEGAKVDLEVCQTIAKRALGLLNEPRGLSASEGSTKPESVE